jgi:hypothetical protein
VEVCPNAGAASISVASSEQMTAGTVFVERLGMYRKLEVLDRAFSR